MKQLKNKRIVCLGGGSGGTSTLLRSLRDAGAHLTSITSMADDGGSSGRLRKAYKILPPGNLVSCIASLAPDEYKEIAEVLMHRFSGSSRENKALGGHKLGNLIMLAEMQRTGDIYKAVELTKKMLGVTNADILPATDTRTRLTAITKDGRRVHGETTLDLTLYSEPRGIKKIYLTPKKPPVNNLVINSLKKADIIISGPGDLYTNQLAVLVIPQIKEALLQSKAKKIFIANIANKPFETKNYSLKNFIDAITEHLGVFPFDTVIANNNHTNPIPKKYRYKYIKIDAELKNNPTFQLLETNLVADQFPLHHDPEKLASIVARAV
jgi:uncharacterized cofD-like protein